MRIPLNLSSRIPTPPDRPQVQPGHKDARRPDAASQSAVQVSLSPQGLEASRKANAGIDPAHLGSAHRIRRGKAPPPVARAGVAPGGEISGRILALQKRLLQEHPNLREEARIAIQERLKTDHGLYLDADHTYFNTFNGARGSSKTYNGWAHEGTPVLSLSLTELQMRNFPADLGEDPNGLNANTGVYIEGVSGKSFGVDNEVRLMSSSLKKAVRANDVGGAYRKKLQKWWDRNEQGVATLYQAQARRWRRLSGLSPDASAMVRKVLQASDGKTVRGHVTAHAFDINSYVSKDMTWLQDPKGRVVLIMPGSAQPLREYGNVDAMRKAIEAMTKTAQGRAELAAHFSLYNRQDGATYQGVEKWLGDIAGGGYRGRIAYAPQPIEGNVFRDQAARTKDAELDDIKRLVKSNSEVIEEESTQFVRVLGQLFPEFFLPAKATELALDVHQALVDGAATDRQQAAQAAAAAATNLAVAAAMGLLAGPIRRVSSPTAAGANERGAYFNAPGRISGGRIGYLLGPSEAPRGRALFDDVSDDFDDGNQMPNEIPNEAANEIPHDWDDDALTLSPPPTRSNSPASDSVFGGSDISLGSSHSSSSGPHRGWWAPGQEPVMGESPPVSAPPSAPPSSPISPLPGLGMIGNHAGLPYLNTLDWVERLDLPHVYRSVPLAQLAERSPEIEGFAADMSLSGNGRSINNRYLFTVETQQGAVDYGNDTFGAGNFAVFRIDAEGVPAIPYRLNLNYDMWSGTQAVITAREAGQPLAPDMEWLSSYVNLRPMAVSDTPAGYEYLGAEDTASYQRGYVFIDSRAVQPNRIHRTI